MLNGTAHHLPLAPAPASARHIVTCPVHLANSTLGEIVVVEYNIRELGVLRSANRDLSVNLRPCDAQQEAGVAIACSTSDL